MARGQGPRSRRTTRGQKSWSDEEMETLRQAYSVWPVNYSLFPDRTKNQVQQQAYRLGLTRGRLVPALFTECTIEEWAYFAGVMDGEGTIGFYSKTGPKSPNGRAFVVVANTDLRLLDWIQARFPGGYGTWYRQRTDRFPEGTPLKDICQLRWTKRSVLKELLTGLLPYLVVKRGRAEEVLAWLAECEAKQRAS